MIKQLSRFFQAFWLEVGVSAAAIKFSMLIYENYDQTHNVATGSWFVGGIVGVCLTGIILFARLFKLFVLFVDDELDKCYKLQFVQTAKH